MAEKTKPTIPFDVSREFAVPHAFRNATLIWPALLDPDTKFGPKFKTGIRFDSEDCEAFEAVQAIAHEARDKFIAAVEAGGYLKKKANKTVNDLKFRDINEDDDEDESIQIMADKKAVDYKGNDLSLLVVDANRNPIPKNTAIGGGTTANVSVIFAPYWMPLLGFGVSVKLQAVQIVKLRTGHQEASADQLFEVVSGGYEAQPAAVGDGDEIEDGGSGDF